MKILGLAQLEQQQTATATRSKVIERKESLFFLVVSCFLLGIDLVQYSSYVVRCESSPAGWPVGILSSPSSLLVRLSEGGETMTRQRRREKEGRFEERKILLQCAKR